MRLRLPCVLILFALPAFSQTAADEARLNQIQVLGSHNSYKQAIDPPLLEMLRTKSQETADSLDYAHETLTQQLNRGLRKLELDVFLDPEGGRYAEPRGLRRLREAGLPAGAPYDPDGLMRRPGLKVLHVQDIDFRTHVYTFQQALEELKAWSDAHPWHLPVAITMNAKDAEIRDDDVEFTRPRAFDQAAFDAWDAEIRAVLPPEKLITPDDVRGSYPTLEAAALAHAWPVLGDARGRFLFVLDERGDKLERYIDRHPSLRGRVMFVNADEGRPEAAFRIVNDPVGDFHYIQDLVRRGYLVRTRADAGTREARQGDYSRMQAAFASGAQYISTDYYVPNPAFGTGYRVALPGGGAGRWNPLLLPAMRPLPSLEPAPVMVANGE